MSTLLDTLAAQIPPEDARLFELCDEVAGRIAAALEAKGWTQRQLAEALGKKESYVSRALAGGVNFTLRTIVQFETALGVRLVRTGDRRVLNEDVASFYGSNVLDTPGAQVALFSSPPLAADAPRRGASGRLSCLRRPASASDVALVDAA